LFLLFSTDLIHELVANGAKLSAKDHNNRGARETAQFFKQQGVIDYLDSHADSKSDHKRK
jgi:hypothetical protein